MARTNFAPLGPKGVVVSEGAGFYQTGKPLASLIDTPNGPAENNDCVILS